MGWFQKLSEGLSKTRDAVTGHLDRLLGRAADPALLDELKSRSSVRIWGMPVVERVMERLRAQMRRGNFSAAEKVRELLRQSVRHSASPQAASIDQLIAQGRARLQILAVGWGGEDHHRGVDPAVSPTGNPSRLPRHVSCGSNRSAPGVGGPHQGGRDSSSSRRLIRRPWPTTGLWLRRRGSTSCSSIPLGGCTPKRT